jgi:PKD repeat protein
MVAVIVAVLAGAGLIGLRGEAGATGGARAASAGPLLGISGNVARFEAETGQESLADQAFLGWGQGLAWGTPFAVMLPTLGPVPMLHLGTKGPDGREAITPGAIAAGAGDAYLAALNRAIAAWGEAIYVRPMAEMNNASNYYSGFTESGAAKDAAHSPAEYRLAFARIYLILHGGTADAIDARLRQLGLPPLEGGDLLANPFPTLRIVWSPLASDNPRVPGNTPAAYYPGAQFVDVEGGDIYDEELTDTAPWAGLEALFKSALARKKPFSVPEWGLSSVDDPAFVRHMCTFLSTHRATETALYYESRPGSPFDLVDKPASRAAYRACVVPLGGALPAWAAANAPGAGARAIGLALTPEPAAGASPLAVRLAIVAQLSVPIAHWQLLFGDGTDAEGAGPPPASLAHTYAGDGIYQPTLFVYRAPPFTPADTPFYVSATVTAGAAAAARTSFVPAPATGPAPLAVSFRTDLDLPANVAGWTIVLGDGYTREGTGRPPHFVGHTYETAGTYRALLLVEAPAGTSYAATAQVVAGGPGGSGGGSTTAPPASGTQTGTVLVDGRPFTGGRIPYGSTVDVTHGRLRLHTDAGTVTLYGEAGVHAAFVLTHGTDRGKPIVVLQLTGGDFGVCPKRTTKSAREPGSVKKTVRALWGNAKGHFRTKGRYAAATIGGTIWLTADRCDGTLVQVRRGVVRVSDLPLRKQVSVRAGGSYLAKP